MVLMINLINLMHMNMIEWLRENKEYLSIRAIEKKIGCPPDILSKAINGRQKLSEKWHEPLRIFLDKFINSLSIYDNDVK